MLSATATQEAVLTSRIHRHVHVHTFVSLVRTTLSSHRSCKLTTIDQIVFGAGEWTWGDTSPGMHVIAPDIMSFWLQWFWADTSYETRWRCTRLTDSQKNGLVHGLHNYARLAPPLTHVRYLLRIFFVHWDIPMYILPCVHGYQCSLFRS